MRKKRPEKPDCFKCEHFHITWDKKFPNGCRAFKFKSKKLPSVDVLKSSGQECLALKCENPAKATGMIVITTTTTPWSDD